MPSRTGPDVPQRIVSLVPAVTEMLFELGAGDRVVGVTDFDAHPVEALEIPRVGALLDPNIERIFELSPDLVVTYGSQAMLESRLESAGIQTLPFVTRSVGDMLNFLEILGERIGEPDAGQRLAGDIRTSLEEIRSEAPRERPKVLLAHSRDSGTITGFYTEGGPSYLNELVEIAGGVNLFADVGITSFQPSLEEVLERRPEVIIELLPSDAGNPEKLRSRAADWNALASVPAVREGRVYVFADDSLLLIGPRLPSVARRLAEAIHPPRDDDAQPDNFTRAMR